MIVGVLVAVVALVAGGLVYFLAIRESDSVAEGAPTPAAAAQNLVDRSTRVTSRPVHRAAARRGRADA
ncbi:hypothetical protein [Kibdelosporangium philippinense]|uniref:hypothetical protein n=1 Tax=Kibdelosporangium philippinense TaxID=211113 RepID=UPI0036178D86